MCRHLIQYQSTTGTTPEQRAGHPVGGGSHQYGRVRDEGIVERQIQEAREKLSSGKRAVRYPVRSKAEDTPLIYFTAHYDSISSNHPKLNTCP